MAYPAAVLNMHLDEYNTFKCLANLLLSNDFMHALYNFKLDKVIFLYYIDGIN